MGKNKVGSGGDRREPINQPIRIFGESDPAGRGFSRVSLDRFRPWMEDADRTIDEKLGDQIRRMRESDGVSVEELARRLKLSAARLKKIEAGKGQLTVSLLERIVFELKASLSFRIIGT